MVAVPLVRHWSCVTAKVRSGSEVDDSATKSRRMLHNHRIQPMAVTLRALATAVLDVRNIWYPRKHRLASEKIIGCNRSTEQWEDGV